MKLNVDKIETYQKNKRLWKIIEEHINNNNNPIDILKKIPFKLKHVRFKNISDERIISIIHHLDFLVVADQVDTISNLMRKGLDIESETIEEAWINVPGLLQVNRLNSFQILELNKVYGLWHYVDLLVGLIDDLIWWENIQFKWVPEPVEFNVEPLNIPDLDRTIDFLVYKKDTVFWQHGFLPVSKDLRLQIDLNGFWLFLKNNIFAQIDFDSRKIINNSITPNHLLLSSKPKLSNKYNFLKRA